MGEVVYLRSSERAIALLEEILQDLRQGKIESFAMAYTVDDDEIGSAISLPGDASTTRLIGATEILRMRLLAIPLGVPLADD